MAYKTFTKPDYNHSLNLLKNYFKNDNRVSKAWIFGSFARQEDKPGSDIDIMVKYSDKATGTLLDYADIQFNLEKILKRKIDLVEEGYVKPFAMENIKSELKLIYG
ncbi:MAG: nucleotidyltransferase domain-containing protein [Bacteroidota bacterium]|nr:nucleotidyltransferase domain-containing protein [Bacteroidota bacterium]MDQ6903753.1 nucleotidyltransferase domain-containing protein [Bacteroidota bacterium]